MPYPFAPGEVLTATNLNAALNQRMMADGTGLAFPPGAIIFGATTGKFATDSTNIFFDDTNNRLGIQTNTPQAMLQIGKTTSTARIYNQYTDTANGAWAYLGDWGKTAGVATYGSDKNGSGIVADVSIVRGGTEVVRFGATGITMPGGIVSTPSAASLPVLLGTAAMAGAVRGVTVVGNYAYTTTQLLTPSDTIEIFDISVPTAPVKVGGLPLVNQAINNPVVAGHVLYTGCNAAATGLQVVDVSNPKQPLLLASLSIGGQAVGALAVSGGYLYMGHTSSVTFRVYDISNPASPGFHSNLTMPGANGARGIILHGKYAYVSTGQAVAGVGGLYIIDVSDPATPSLTGTYNTASGFPTGMAISGKYLFVNGGGAAIEIVDVSDPATPVAARAPFTTVGASSSAANPIIAGDYLYYLTSTATGIQVINIADPMNPVSVGSASTIAGVLGAALSGNRLFVTANAQLRIYNTFGVDASSVRAGALATDILNVDGSSYFAGDMYAQRGLIVGQQGIHSRGPIFTDASEAAVPISAVFGLGLVCFGLFGSTFAPALKRAVGNLQVRLSDDSAYAGLEASTLALGGAGVAAAGNPLDIRRDFDGLTSVTVTNASTGVAAQTRAIYANDASTGQLMLGVMGTLATTNGVFLQDGAYISAEAGLAGGLNLMTRAAAPIRFATNGQANERMQITSAGLITFGGITNGFPALKRNLGTLEVRYADDSGYTNLVASWVGIGATPLTPLDLRGTFTTTTEATFLNAAGTLRSNSTFYHWAAWFGTTINPTAATTSLAAGVGISNILAGSSGIYNASAAWIRTDITTYTGTTAAYIDGISMSDTVGLSATKYAYQHTGIRITAVTNGHGSNFNGIANIGLQVDGPTSGPAVGGVIHNRCLNLNIPSGSGAGTTTNSGIYMGGSGGSGGGGATTNYAILSDSPALSVIASLRIGNSLGLGNPTNATAPMLYITAVAGQPTATPLYNQTGTVAIQFDTTNKKLWAFDPTTNTWKGVVLA